MRLRALVCLLAGLVLGWPTPASPAPPTYAPPDLNTLIAHAGYIFRGTVLAIERAPATVSPSQSPPPHTAVADAIPPRPRASRIIKPPSTTSAIRVTFLVSDAIRGVRDGQRITITEWSGLWIGDPHRYRVGDDLLLILYPASRIGLTSPVAGDLGRFAIAADERVVATGAQRRMLTPSALLPSRAPRIPEHLTYAELAARLRQAARR